MSARTLIAALVEATAPIYLVFHDPGVYEAEELMMATLDQNQAVDFAKTNQDYIVYAVVTGQQIPRLSDLQPIFPPRDRRLGQ